MLLEIIGPFLLIIGLLGNAINFYIFTNPNLRSLSTFRFLTYLSIIDFLYLLTGLTHLLIIIYFDYDLRLISNFLCSFHSFLTIYLSHLSSNTLAAISISRCFKLIRLKPVKNEMKKLTKVTSVDKNDTFLRNNNNRKFKITIGHADYTILLIMIILFLFDSHYLLWMRLSDPEISNSTLNNETLVTKQCHPSLNKQFYYNKFLATTWVWIDLFLYSYIPFVIMMVCTVLITYKLYKVNKNIGRSKMSNNNQQHQSISNQNQTFIKKRAKKTNQIYKLLILINVCFFVLVTPLVLSNSLGILVIENKIILELVYILSYSNHCINFVFYGLSCKIYRTILYDCLLNKNKNNQINSNNKRLTVISKL
jgi:hypothetical protein